MPTDSNAQPGMTWLIFALGTVVSWGVYGIFLHSGSTAMADPVNGRYKAFLFVGLAYVLTAVLAPLAMLVINKASWHMPFEGMKWSLIAGIVGAAGAFFVLLAFGAKGVPAVVMSIVFAGAPIVNAVVSIAISPPAGGLGGIKPQFYVGLALAAIGGCLVTLYKPAPSKPHGPAKHAAVAATTAATAPAAGDTSLSGLIDSALDQHRF